jgi:ubiquinol-cytochrome c reductase cytochrome b subunit
VAEDRRPEPAEARPEALTEDSTETPSGDATELERLVGWLDQRTGIAAVARVGLRKVFPDHWTFLLGEVALFCLIVLVATGTFLTFFYTADARQTIYDGAYPTLKGASVSAAFDSVMRLSFEVRAGLLMRQVHHWAALIFIGAIAVHLARIFFTGAYRRPREINWLIGLSLLVLALGEGITGYSLPDDLLSGVGLRIIYSAVLAVPFAGPWIASLFFGGDFPTEDVLGRLFVFHIMLLPAFLLGGVAIHIGLVYLQKHTQYRGGRATESNVVGLPFWPGQAFRSVGLFFLTTATIVLVAGFVQINPVWQYGPYVPYVATVPAQPDWYVGWLEGALRIGLPIEPTIFGITIPAPFVPGILLPGLLVLALVVWPFVEARLTHDRAEHHLLDVPWDAPVRTATGAAGIALFLVLTLAGGNDVLAVILDVPVEGLTVLFRILLVVAPAVTWLLTFAVARELRSRQAGPATPATVILARTESGGFEEIEP